MGRTAKLGITTVGIVTLIALLWLILAIANHAGPASAAKSFFRSIADKGAQVSYASTSPSFQSVTPVQTWIAVAQARGLGDYRSSSWTTETNKDGLAELSGVITLKSGGAIPAKVGLLKGAGGWSVLSVELPQGGLTAGQGTATAPIGAGAEGTAPGAAASTPSPAPPLPAVQADQNTQQPESGVSPSTIAGAQPDAPAGLVGVAPTPGTGPVGPVASETISHARLSRICGEQLVRRGRVNSLEVHCPTGLAATPGSTARCIAVINGHGADLTATLNTYDPVSDHADLSCRLDE